MVEYLEFGANVGNLVDVLYEQGDNYSQELGSGHKDRATKHIDKQFFEVRQSVCVAGHHRQTVQEIKVKIAELVSGEVALESFVVRDASDLDHGALLVPKVILVGVHYPGRKLLDDVGDKGQLDMLYDRVCDTGSDVLVIYTGLPKSLYQPMRHIVYHPKLEEIVFPNQPLLKHLASDNCLLTVCEGSDLTNMQQNVIKEWLEKPVAANHPVFEAANSMSTANELSPNEGSLESEDSYSDLKTLADQVSKSKPMKMPRTMFKKPHKRDPRTGLPILRDRLTTLDEGYEYGVDNPGLEMDDYQVQHTTIEIDNTVTL